MSKKRSYSRFRWIGLIGAVLLLLFWFSLPEPLFDKPLSTVLYDRDGHMLSGRIAADEQWRFPSPDSLPKRLEECILQFEDKRFYYHPGVDPFALIRAIGQNIRAGMVVSGASTISMQLIRLSRDQPDRTVIDKLWEMWLALRLEMRYSKDEILRLYATHAPYGGNVVGVEAAAWRYFSRPLHQLSWAECATLAVLPNAPSAIFPGREDGALRRKRDGLLLRLMEKAIIDSTTYALAILEEIPGQAAALPHQADHALAHLMQLGEEEQRLESSLSLHLQQRAQAVLDRYMQRLLPNRIQNAAALIVHIPTGEVRAYLGNTRLPGTPSAYVDIVQARRSSGSILKPFLYACAFEEGLIHPKTLLRDVPVRIDDFAPGNFDGNFKGLVRADEALATSLNVPAVLLLRDYGIGRFLQHLQQMDMRYADRSADDYGLSLILGGAEVCLWDLANNYAVRAAGLSGQSIQGIQLIKDATELNDSAAEFDRAAWWMISEALTEVERPGVHAYWKSFASGRRIAWKTGTSQGFRDAWSIGYDRDHLVAVWVGNADGEGRAGLTGASIAGPLMFSLFDLLPPSRQWEAPLDRLHPVSLCAASGKRPGPHCPTALFDALPDVVLEAACTSHKPILLNEDKERVLRSCAPPPYTDSSTYLVEPVAAYYFKGSHSPLFRQFPWSATCREGVDAGRMAFIYPNRSTRLIIPTDLSGEREKVVLKATHSREDATLYWHLNGRFLGMTNKLHELVVDMEEGAQELLLLDERGQRKSLRFDARLAGSSQ